jgi:hypothetical protein
MQLGSVLISRAKAFNRKGREGLAKVAKKAHQNQDIRCDWIVF